MTILFSVLACICVFGLIGDKLEAKKYYAFALAATIAGAVAIRIVEMM